LVLCLLWIDLSSHLSFRPDINTANCKNVVRFELWLLEKSHFKQNQIFKK
jgi:hypothetical protein